MRRRAATLVVSAVLAGLAAPAHAAAATDSCTLGSPNIVRDVTECVQYVTAGCAPLSSPNIITDLLECLPR